MSEKERFIFNWIAEVSKVRPELNGFAICPFASKSKYRIVECSASAIEPIEDLDVVIYIIEGYFSLDEVQKWVDICNQKYKEWKFFEDCASYDTFINGIKTNNGKYNLILGQPTQKLRKFRENLSKTSYYDMWEGEYLKEILEDDYDIIQKRDSNPVKSSDLTDQERKMTKKVDKNQDFMKNEWGTQYLSSEYGWENKINNKKMLREINDDDLTPKKHDFHSQSEIHEKIRNDDDYDDWEYGTEPIFG